MQCRQLITYLPKKEQKRAKKLANEQERLMKSLREADHLCQQIESRTSCTDVADTQPSLQSPPPTKRGRKTVISSDLVSTLDRSKVSSRSAVLVIGAAAKTLGHDVTSLTLN